MNAVPEIREAPGAPWVIIAPNRSDRIAAFAGGPAITPADCPFCPGHEAETPPEITRTADGSAWRMRVAPNKYPAIGQPRGELEIPVKRVVPVPGGFEIGSGTFINVVAPETAAADLRPFFTE